MLPTFVIGLREGLEAALIVGIIAAFLRRQGRRDAVKWVLAGVASAVTLCAAGGIALDAFSHTLPQRQQEGLETVIGALAVAMVTYMVVWMRRNSRHLRGQLEGMAADALSAGSAAGSRGLRAMVLMAFLAVIREGFETVVFLLAAFDESGSGASAGLGALLGIAVALALGYGIYRGGVRLDLSKFFRATGLVLVLVAAGLVVNALHTAHEAGWLDTGQGGTVDLGWLVRPGTVQASLLTGMLGIQSHPVVVEVIGWLLYLVPVGCYVAWPPARTVPLRTVARWSSGVALLAGAGAVVLALVAPGAPASRPTTTDGSAGAVRSARVVAAGPETVVLRTTGSNAGVEQFRLTSVGSGRTGDVVTDVYRGFVPTAVTGRPARLAAGRVAALNGGRLPIGLGSAADFPVSYAGRLVVTAHLDPRTDRVVELVRTERVSASVKGQPLPRPIASATAAFSTATVARALSAVRADAARAHRDDVETGLAAVLGALACVALLTSFGIAVAGRRRTTATIDAPVARPRELAQS